MAVRSTQETELVSSSGSSNVRSTQETMLVSSRGGSNIRSTQEVLLISTPFNPLGINYPLIAPAIAGLGPQDFSLTGLTVVGESDSPFTLSQELQLWSGQMLLIEANFPPMLTSEGEQWVAFFLSLLGKYGTFLMGDYNRQTPQGAMSGTPVVNGTNASGSNQLLIRGANPSVSNWAVAGDYIQATAPGFPQRIYKVLQNAATDPSGDATLEIFPNLREGLSDGTAIITANCAGTFRLQQNSFSWKIDRNKMYSISFKAKEALSN